MDKFRILIVDDSRIFRQVLREGLQESFPTIAIDEATNEGEALQKVDLSPPNLILLDIRLLGENGIELAKKIKATHSNIPVFILTGYDIPEYREVALRYGADGFLIKSSLSRMKLEELVKSYQEV